MGDDRKDASQNGNTAGAGNTIEQEWLMSDDSSAKAFRNALGITLNEDGSLSRNGQPYGAAVESGDGSVESDGKVATAPDSIEKSFEDLLTDLEGQKRDYDEQSRKEVKAARVSDTFAGATEAAVALVNLFGVSKGAAPASWTSPRSGLQGRLDTLRKERDNRLRQYQSMVNDIRKKRADYALSKDRIEAAKESREGVQDRAELNAKTRVAVASINAETALRKARMASESKISSIESSERKAVLSQAGNTVTSQIRAYEHATGYAPTQSMIDQWYSDALDRATAARKSLLPDPSE